MSSLEVDTLLSTTTTTSGSDSISSNNDKRISDTDAIASQSTTATMPPSLEQQSDATQQRKSRLAVASGGGEPGPDGGPTSSPGVVGGNDAGLGSVSSGISGTGFSSRGGSRPRHNLLSSHTNHFNFPGGNYFHGSGALGGISSNYGTSYLSRLVDFRQMDIQSALDQMKTLLSTRAHVVYKTSYYRKQTKNHWARDDPAFVAIQGVFLFIASLAYSVAFRTSITGSISFILASVLWNWLGLGIAFASIGREIANRHLTVHQSSSHVKQSVEWLYSFDIHCNAFFPVFVLLYGVQFFLLPLVLRSSFLAFFISNTLYAISFSWYWYITHLGYRTLPFLSNTEVFLFPIVAIGIVYVLNIILYPLGFGYNASRIMAEFYFA